MAVNHVDPYTLQSGLVKLWEKLPEFTEVEDFSDFFSCCVSVVSV